MRWTLSLWFYDEHVKSIMVEVNEDAFFMWVSSLDDEVLLVRYSLDAILTTPNLAVIVFLWGTSLDAIFTTPNLAVFFFLWGNSSDEILTTPYLTVISTILGLHRFFLIRRRISILITPPPGVVCPIFAYPNTPGGWRCTWWCTWWWMCCASG